MKTEYKFFIAVVLLNIVLFSFAVLGLWGLSKVYKRRIAEESAAVSVVVKNEKAKAWYMACLERALPLGCKTRVIDLHKDGMFE